MEVVEYIGRSMTTANVVLLDRGENEDSNDTKYNGYEVLWEVRLRE